MSKELINRIAEDNGISKTQASAEIKRVFDGISKELIESESVGIKDFGTFNKSRFKKKSVLFNKEYNVDTNVVRLSIYKKLKTLING